LILSCFIAIGFANGASRTTINNNRVIKTTFPGDRRISTTQQKTNNNNKTTRSETTQVTRSATKQNVAPRTATRTVVSARSNMLWPAERKRVVSRAATITEQDSVAAFGPEYTTCHDAYFSCMDQFCASLDETYRRCICSSRLNEIKQKQSALSESSDSLAGFHDLNLSVVNKTAAEVGAMTSATIGEQIASSARDTSDSAQQLSAIGDVLSKKRSESLSTSGMLDAGGDIKSIWATTDLANGANIANLTGETLFNAVNAQCSKIVSDQCPESILNMVISAYGMYIENDCATLATDLSKKKNSANTAIRETGRELGVARLENYDAHNSLSINDCVASVRNDVTANTACGPDFVHCLDVTGLYLNIDTGAPIYSKNFFNLANQISLTGNILNNQTNHMAVNALNSKKVFAKNSLDKCRDKSSDVWDEFMRQAIIEIHQKQQEKIRDVKTECLGVVNQCYDTQTNQLKDFSNVDEKSLLGLQLETVEDFCREKLDTCSNLYGGGPNGLAELVNNMHNIVDQKIEAECQKSLQEFGTKLCTVQSTDTIHSYPYACRTYAPGDQTYAIKKSCNNSSNSSGCGDYIGSLYQTFVNYAMQVCVRPSEYETMVSNWSIPTLVLQDINIVMDKMRISMGQELARECERFGGTWVTNPYNDTSIKLREQFYSATGSNNQWGYCKESTNKTKTTYTITLDNGTSSSNSANIAAIYGERTADILIPKRTYEEVTDPDADPPTTVTRNYTFAGYYTMPDGGGVKYYDHNGRATHEYDIESNTTLYAHWYEHAITWDGMGVYKTDDCPIGYDTQSQDQTISCSGNKKQQSNISYTCTGDNCTKTFTFKGWCEGNCSVEECTDNSCEQESKCYDDNNTPINPSNSSFGVNIEADTTSSKHYCATWKMTCSDCNTYEGFGSITETLHDNDFP